MLTGAFTTDVSDASGMLLLDVRRRKWSEEMLDICGIREEMLPEIRESYEISGYLKPEITEWLGLPGEIAAVAGAGDNAAAAIGTGTVGNGSCNISIGTSGTVFIACDSFTIGENNAIHAFGHANGKYHLMGCMLSAASCLKWWLEDILRSSDYSGEQSEIEGIGDNPVYFLPYLMGERSPHNDPNARGAFLGLGIDTSRSQMAEAVFEGVAFALKDSLEIARSLGIEITKATLCGGGAKSAVWRRILANILELEIEIPEAEEGPALGGAILVAAACGEYASVEDAAKSITRVKEIIRPQKKTVDAYRRKYEVFRGLYPAIKGVL
jgi:xylulokinase